MPTRAASVATSLAQRCPICWEEYHAPVLTPCGHRFCEACICQALQCKLECPTCRQPCASHRSLRADVGFAQAIDACSPQRVRLEAETDVPGTELWACAVCTLSNPLASAHCLACTARRPAAAMPRPTRSTLEEPGHRSEPLRKRAHGAIGSQRHREGAMSRQREPKTQRRETEQAKLVTTPPPAPAPPSEPSLAAPTSDTYIRRTGQKLRFEFEVPCAACPVARPGKVSTGAAQTVDRLYIASCSP